MPKTVAINEPPRKKTRKVATISEPTVFKPSPTLRRKLQTLRQHFTRKIKDSKKVPAAANLNIKRSYQPVAERDLKRMVYLRFGNLEGTGEPIRSYNEVAEVLRKWPMTVHSALKRWERNGKKALDGRAKNGQHMKQRAILQGPIKDFLLNR